jgi:large subunit ribosomal protein L23Ae
MPAKSSAPKKKAAKEASGGETAPKAEKTAAPNDAKKTSKAKAAKPAKAAAGAKSAKTAPKTKIVKDTTKFTSKKKEKTADKKAKTVAKTADKKGASKDSAKASKSKTPGKTSAKKAAAAKKPTGKISFRKKFPPNRKHVPYPYKRAERIAAATKIKKTIEKGNRIRIRKIHFSPHFKLAPTLKLKRNPKYPRRSAPKRPRYDQYRIIKFPLTTESAMKKMEDHNTLVFICDVRANKPQIKQAVKKLYDIKASRINTLVRPDGQKKAYVRLAAEVDALDIANKIGII